MQGSFNRLKLMVKNTPGFNSPTLIQLQDSEHFEVTVNFGVLIIFLSDLFFIILFLGKCS